MFYFYYRSGGEMLTKEKYGGHTDGSHHDMLLFQLYFWEEESIGSLAFEFFFFFLFLFLISTGV
jgi:hypothetical protein